MRVPLNHLIQIALALAAAGCILPGGQRIDPLSGGQQVETTPRPMPDGRSTPERGIMPKRVTGKQEPNVLLADDGTSCTVTADRYREVQLGKYAICAWR